MRLPITSLAGNDIHSHGEGHASLSHSRLRTMAGARGNLQDNAAENLRMCWPQRVDYSRNECPYFCQILMAMLKGFIIGTV